MKKLCLMAGIFTLAACNAHENTRAYWVTYPAPDDATGLTVVTESKNVGGREYYHVGKNPGRGTWRRIDEDSEPKTGQWEGKVCFDPTDAAEICVVAKEQGPGVFSVEQEDGTTTAQNKISPPDSPPGGSGDRRWP